MNMENMDSLPLRERDVSALEHFVKQIKRVLGDDLVSIILYGSVVKDNYFPGSSDINVLVIVNEITPKILQAAAPVIKGHSGRDKISTFLADFNDINDSADVFPIKHLDMKRYHRVILGKDIFSEIEVTMHNLRNDLERQVRNVVLRLRQMYIHSNYTAGELREILVSNFSGFSQFLSTLLFLKGIEPPVKKEEIVQIASEKLDIDFAVLEEIVELKRGKNNPPRSRMQEIYYSYLDVVDKIVEIVDKLEVLDMEY